MAGFMLILTLVVVLATAFSWSKLFQSWPFGSMTVALWFAMLVSGNISFFFAFLFLGWVLYVHREWILSWYYSLTPHPAERIVEQALSGNSALDVDSFAQAIRQTTGENDYERAARSKQVTAITERWRERERALRESEEQLVGSERQRTERENELFHAQAEALEAAIAHEKAAARFEELKRRQRRDDQ